MAAGITIATKLIIAGDFQAGYLIADRLGMQVELIPHLFGAANRFQPPSVACSQFGGPAAV
jgi:predicted phage gp36 major capsid-like protein